VRVAQRFLEQGEDGLLDRRRENGEPKADEQLRKELRTLVAAQPQDYGWTRSTWSRELLAKTLMRETGVRASERTIGRMLLAISARFGMARPLPKKTLSPKTKKKHVDAILAKLATLPKNEVAFYQDEVDIHLNPKIGRDWMLARKQKGVVTPGKNEKRYVYGALSISGDRLVTVTSAHKNSRAFIDFLERLRAANPRARRLHLVLDNYIIHKSQETRRYLAQREGFFVLHFLPAYSPEHNRIERLWRDLHGNVTRNHRCRSMAELMKRVRYWLRRELVRRSRKRGARGRVGTRAAA
jgi:transposase